MIITPLDEPIIITFWKGRNGFRDGSHWGVALGLVHSSSIFGLVQDSSLNSREIEEDIEYISIDLVLSYDMLGF